MIRRIHGNKNMMYVDFDGDEYPIYGFELVWKEKVYDDDRQHRHTIQHSQFFLDYEFDKAEEIARRLKCRSSTVQLLYLTSDFKRMFGYEVDLD